MQSLMSRAAKSAPKGPKFKAPDVSQFIPEELRDKVERIVAAGVRFIYSPQVREQVMQDIQRDVPVPQKLAESTLGLMLTLDQQAKGGLPADALFPAGMQLLGEAAEVLSAAGQAVDQEDYNEAARMLFVLMSKKMGMSDDDIMATAEKAASGAAQTPTQQQAEPPAAMPADSDEAAREAEAQAAWDEEGPKR